MTVEPGKLEGLSDPQVRALLSLVAAGEPPGECPHCSHKFSSTELPKPSTTCPACGGLWSEWANGDSPSAAEAATVSAPIALVSAPYGVSLPSRLDRFEIRSVLGCGGFGRVYRAYDPRSRREVAIKLPRREKFVSDQLYAAYVERFLEEGRRTAQLRHPHVVEVYEVGREATSGTPYIVMEFVPEGTLEQRLRRGPALGRQTALQIVEDTASAVQFAHAQQIYHCDLKPSNILLTQRLRAKVTDFGLALHEDEQLAQEGQVAGTLPYMSPEQLDGQRHHLDGRTDIWSLGVILYELLAGRRPFEGDDRQLRQAIAKRAVRPLAQRDPTIPAQLDVIIGRCLEKSVDARYPTAGTLARDLRGLRPVARRTLCTLAGGGLLLAGGLWGYHEWRAHLPTERLVELGAWAHLPLGEPKRLHWPRSELNAQASYDGDRHEVHILSAGLALIELGWTRSGSWAIEVDVTPRRFEGWAGMFFGYRPATKGDQQGFQFQTLCFEQAGSRMARRSVLVRRIYSLLAYAPQSYEEHTETRYPVDLPGNPRGPLTLKIRLEFRGGFLSNVTAGDSRFPELAAPHERALELDRTWPPSYGRFGLLNWIEDSLFANCRCNFTAYGEMEV